MTSGQTSNIDYPEIYRYASYAKSAYLEGHEFARAYRNDAFIRVLPQSKVQVALIPDPDRDVQWIAIRGTANPKNVFVDGRIKVVREPQSKLCFHGGFLRAAIEVLHALQPIVNPERELRITGHSLGGAVALILAVLLTNNARPYRVGRIVTFGQPMVTDINGVRALRHYPLLRVVNKWDPVSVLPFILSRTHFEFPPTIFYYHVGQQLTLLPDRGVKLSAPGRLVKFAFGYKRLIQNHFMDLYLQRLKAISE